MQHDCVSLRKQIILDRILLTQFRTPVTVDISVGIAEVAIKEWKVETGVIGKLRDGCGSRRARSSRDKRNIVDPLKNTCFYKE